MGKAHCEQIGWECDYVLCGGAMIASVEEDTSPTKPTKKMVFGCLAGLVSGAPIPLLVPSSITFPASCSMSLDHLSTISGLALNNSTELLRQSLWERTNGFEVFQ